MAGVRSRTRRAIAVALGAAMGVAALGGVDAAAAGDGDVLRRDMRGEEAIRALGRRLPAVAEQNDMSPSEFRGALRADAMVWVGRTGQLLFVDDFATDHDHAETSDPALESSLPAGTDVFALDSRPSAARVIVLDFNGHDARGTAWGSTDSQIALPYDSDGDPSTFSADEQAQIHGVWQRVSEDFAPFDVNVTTRDHPHTAYQPGHERIRRDSLTDPYFGTRVVVTPSKTYNCNCGGVAYVGVYDLVGADHDQYQPAWVFTAGVGTGAKSIAEAASHEAGHNLGLSHDGTKRSGYYTGHGDWAPIMGVGYHEPITQWSRGEYSGANNKEDDFAVMQANQLPLGGDDHADASDGATPLPVDTTTTPGVIGSAADVDAFSFTTSGGTVVLDAQPAAVSPNLDLRLRVVDGAGALAATVDPPSDLSDGNDLSIGMDATTTVVLAAGNYTVLVDGVGFGDPATTGYSDWASVGRYALTSTVTNDGASPDGSGGGGDTGGDTTTAPAAPTGLASSVSGSTITLTWSDNSSDETHFELVREFLHRNGSWRGTTTITVSAGSGTTVSHDDSPGSGTYRYRVRSVNGAGTSAFTDWTEATVSGSGGGKPAKTR